MSARARWPKGAAVVIVALLGVVALAGCPAPKTVHIAGKTKSIDLVVKLAALDDSEITSIGSFTLTLNHDGTALAPIPLNFSTTDQTLTFLDDNAGSDLPPTGKLTATLQAADLAGAGLQIGGTSTPLDLDGVPRGTSASIFVVVGRLDAPTPLPETVSTPSVAATVIGTGLLANGDWFDFATGAHLTLASALVDISLDPFASSCSLFGHGLLENGAGQLAEFDPSATSADTATGGLNISLSSPHSGGVAFATNDCRVFFVGGDSTNKIDVVDLSAAVASVSSTAGITASKPALVDLTDALGDRAVIGGNPEGTATLVTPSSTGATVCTSNDVTCNGSAANMLCARDEPAAALIDDGSDLKPTLIAGGSACSATPVELMIQSQDQPFTRFIAVDTAPVGAHGLGVAMAPFGKNRAIVVGGQSTAIDVFTLTSVDVAGNIAHGTWEALPPLADNPGDTHVFALGGAVLVVSENSAKLEVIVPPLDGAT